MPRTKINEIVNLKDQDFNKVLSFFYDNDLNRILLGNNNNYLKQIGQIFQNKDQNNDNDKQELLNVWQGFKVNEKYKIILLCNLIITIREWFSRKTPELIKNITVTPEFEFTNNEILGKNVEDMIQDSAADKALTEIAKIFQNNQKAWDLTCQRTKVAAGGAAQINMLEILCNNPKHKVKFGGIGEFTYNQIWPNIQEQDVIIEFDLDISVIEVRHRRVPLKNLISETYDAQSGLIDNITTLCKEMIFKPCQNAGLFCDVTDSEKDWKGNLQCHMNVGREIAREIEGEIEGEEEGEIERKDDLWDPFTFLEFYKQTMTAAPVSISGVDKEINENLVSTAAINSGTIDECANKKDLKKDLNQEYTQCIQTLFSLNKHNIFQELGNININFTHNLSNIDQEIKKLEQEIEKSKKTLNKNKYLKNRKKTLKT